MAVQEQPAAASEFHQQKTYIQIEQVLNDSYSTMSELIRREDFGAAISQAQCSIPWTHYVPTKGIGQSVIYGPIKILQMLLATTRASSSRKAGRVRMATRTSRKPLTLSIGVGKWRVVVGVEHLRMRCNAAYVNCSHSQVA